MSPIGGGLVLPTLYHFHYHTHFFFVKIKRTFLFIRILIQIPFKRNKIRIQKWSFEWELTKFGCLMDLTVAPKVCLMRNGWNKCDLLLEPKIKCCTQTCHSIRWRMNATTFHRCGQNWWLESAGVGVDVVAVLPLLLSCFPLLPVEMYIPLDSVDRVEIE